ncbi:hypothetical protein J6I90_10005 [Pseudidiomarina sp. 1APP75-32.1]|uniref:Uncharacterized protein n=1 Tax=Pseudidiomarina terrestris TaxID=2820060 RepID=A0AAW7R1S0_9GAMM|nr:hypothetical protein [Pseudidiomarina sp. 1APP75-32.1]MDN7125214.1 hypothetical protein [Pseudidiomarina sp. 1APP75-32.1]
MNIDDLIFPQEQIPFPKKDSPELVKQLVALTLAHDINLSRGLTITVELETVTLKVKSDAFTVEFKLNALQTELSKRTCTIEFQEICVPRRPIHWVESVLINTLFTVQQFGYRSVAVFQPPSRLHPLLKRMAFSYDETTGLHVFSPF